MIKFLTAAAAVIAAAAALAQAATAIPPTTADSSEVGSLTLDAGTLCSFPIVLDYTQDRTITTFYGSDGVITKRITTGTEQDTFTANGKTVVGDPYHFTVLAEFENGVRVSRYWTGNAERVHLPDDGIFILAGRTLIPPSGLVVTVDSGNAGNNLAAFCAALS
jgi:hypothetical protein